jgi:hypothetical protein
MIITHIIQNTYRKKKCMWGGVGRGGVVEEREGERERE